MTIFRFAFIRSLRSKLTLLVLCAIPCVLILIRSLWQADYRMGFSLYAMAMMYGSFLLVRSMMTDRITGTIIRIFAAPITTFQYLSQNLLAFVCLLMVQILFIVGLGTLRYQWSLYFCFGLILCYTVFAGASIGFSLTWHSLFRSKEISNALFGIVTSLISILGGIFFPIQALPEFLQKIAMVFPTFWFSAGLTALQTEGMGVTYWLSNIALLLFTLAFLIFGSKRRLE